MYNCLSALQFVKYLIGDDFSISPKTPACALLRLTKSCDLSWLENKSLFRKYQNA